MSISEVELTLHERFAKEQGHGPALSGDEALRLIAELRVERERAANWRLLYVDACEAVGSSSTEADKAYQNVYGKDGT